MTEQKVKRITFWGRLKAAARAFKGKPMHVLHMGLDVKPCDKCEAFLASQREPARWIEGDYGESLKLACSACGAPFEYRTSHCPDCGAKMN